MEEIKIYTGILRKVPTDEHFQKYKEEKFDLREVKIKDTIRELTKEGEIIQYLPIKISYSEVDENGNEKFILSDDGDFEKVFKYSPILYAYGKEMRIIKSFNENHPLKLVINKINLGEKTIHKIIAVQDQTQGKL